MKDLRAIERDADWVQRLLVQAKNILSSLGRPHSSGPTPEEAAKAWNLIDRAEGRISGLITYLTLQSVERGRKGGSKTAERGPDYFRQIAAMRKTRGGGRPKKQTNGSDTP
jgi:hypothetical protein